MNPSPISSPKSPARGHTPRPVSPKEPVIGVGKTVAEPGVISSRPGLGSLESQSSFHEVNVALKEALKVVNEGISAHRRSVESISPESESDRLSPEIPVLGPPIVNMALQDTDSPSMEESEGPTDGDEWLRSTGPGESLRIPDMTEETTVYHIGTPTLFPTSSNPSIVSSEEPSRAPLAPLSPIAEESNKLGRMLPIKPVIGGKNIPPVPVSQVLKMIVLGDASVGKTAIIQRFVNGTFQALPYKPTVGADFYSQKLEYTSTGETVYITLQIWDTAGQERYKSLASSFYRGADICVIVDDCSRRSSIDTVSQWHEDFLRHAIPVEPESFPFIFLLNKSDLLSESDYASVELSWRNQISERFNIPTSRAALVSAKSGDNVEEALFLAAKLGARRAINATHQIRSQQQRGGVINLNRGSSDDDSIFNCLSQC